MEWKRGFNALIQGRTGQGARVMVMLMLMVVGRGPHQLAEQGFVFMREWFTK